MLCYIIAHLLQGSELWTISSQNKKKETYSDSDMGLAMMAEKYPRRKLSATSKPELKSEPQ